MKEINIARAIIRKRKEKGITQEELANHIGVSGASVSKWETGQSYPDILLLPQLAAYFNISVDELMGYEPQMTKKDIGKLYMKLYEDLSNKPFDEVIDECREKIREYFSCFPLLLQMGTLLMNASAFTDDKEKSSAIMAEARELFVRVKIESDDVELMKSALYMEACCSGILGNHNEVIELLGNPPESMLPHEPLLASAYRLTGRHKEAEAVLQVGIYQRIIAALDLLSSYTMLGFDDADRLDEVVKRTFAIIEVFDIKRIQPATIISFPLTAAMGYLAHQNTDKALDLLEKYAEYTTGDVALRIEGDGFFNLIDDWLYESDMENAMPPHEKIIKQSLADAVINNPGFSALDDNPRFQVIVKRLEDACFA
ncbi:MAG: helix-turn-helix domain-containing protein [Clostridiales bacterium]|jgi:transcriptional regulator with XRE-family HTH domain|nr:helix-turn-helix domain-containing protein [Clostridiales bacterium]